MTIAIAPPHRHHNQPTTNNITFKWLFPPSNQWTFEYTCFGNAGDPTNAINRFLCFECKISSANLYSFFWIEPVLTAHHTIENRLRVFFKDWFTYRLRLMLVFPPHQVCRLFMLLVHIWFDTYSFENLKMFPKILLGNLHRFDPAFNKLYFP